VTAFNETVKDLEGDDKQFFIRELAAMNDAPFTREKWEGLLAAFDDYGIADNEGLKSFVNETMSNLNASYSNNYLKSMGVSDGIIASYRSTLESGNRENIDKFHETFKAWREDYDIANSEAKKTEHELITQVAE
jgi:hypothetical protein